MGNKNTKHIQMKTESLEPTRSDHSIPNEDIVLLNSLGIHIHEYVGSGEVGSVYQGVYGCTAGGIRDCEDQLLDVKPGQQFAIKYIDIKQREEFEFKNNGIERMAKIRKFVEREKEMRKNLLNLDLIQTHICINLGDYHIICLNDEPHKPIPLGDIDVRLSSDRIYLAMDFSILGNLDKYLQNLSSNGVLVTEVEANIWCYRLLSGLKYLHEFNVFDVNIKPQNILMFSEYFRTEEQIYVVPKFSDFYMNDCFGDQTQDNDNSSSNYSTSEDETSDEDEEVKYSDRDLRKMTDIYLLADIFDKIISKTEFKSEADRQLALDLIELMQNFSYKRCDHYSENQWFESNDVIRRHNSENIII